MKLVHPPKKNQILVHPCQGMFQNCWEHTCYLQGGPFFAQCCQSFLQGQKISDEATPAYLASLKSLNRYDFAFKKFGLLHMSKFRSVNKICFPSASYGCISPKEARIAPLEPTRIAPFNAELQTTMAKQCASVCPFPEA